VEGHKDFGSYCRSLDPPISPRWAYQVVENYRAGGRMRDQSRIHLLGYSEIAELVQAPEEDRAAILEEATANGDIPTAARLRQLIDKGQAGQPPAEQLRALSTEDKLQQVEAEEREQLRQERQATSTDLLRQIDRLAARCRRLHTRLDQVEDADLLLAAYRQVIAGVGEGNELALAELRRAAAAFLERVEGRAAA